MANGNDHAGIATQMLVTEQLAKENISASDLGREQFIQKFGIGKKYLETPSQIN